MNKTKADDEVPEKMYTQAEFDSVVTPLNDKIFKMKLAMSSQAMYVRFIMMDLVDIILKKGSLRKLVANAFSHTIDFMARGREFWDDHDRVSFKKVSQDLSDAIDIEAGRDNRWAAVCGSDERGFQPTEWVKEAEEALDAGI